MGTCQSVSRVASLANVAEWIEVQFGLETVDDARNVRCKSWFLAQISCDLRRITLTVCCKMVVKFRNVVLIFFLVFSQIRLASSQVRQNIPSRSNSASLNWKITSVPSVEQASPRCRPSGVTRTLIRRPQTDGSSVKYAVSSSLITGRWSSTNVSTPSTEPFTVLYVDF